MELGAGPSLAAGLAPLGRPPRELRAESLSVSHFIYPARPVSGQTLGQRFHVAQGLTNNGIALGDIVHAMGSIHIEREEHRAAGPLGPRSH